MIEWALFLLAYFGAGFTLKIGDDFLDDFGQPSYAWLPFAASGVLFGFLMAESQWDLLLFSAIIIGVLISGKVNKPQFSIGFVMIGIMLIIRGVPVITSLPELLLILGILLIASIVDERGNDWADRQQTTFVSGFFKYRFTLKVSVLILSIFWPGFWRAAVGLWFFDTGYEAAGIVDRNQFHDNH